VCSSDLVQVAEAESMMSQTVDILFNLRRKKVRICSQRAISSVIGVDCWLT